VHPLVDQHFRLTALIFNFDLCFLAISVFAKELIDHYAIPLITFNDSIRAPTWNLAMERIGNCLGCCLELNIALRFHNSPNTVDVRNIKL